MAVIRKFIDTETTIAAKDEAEATTKFRAIWPSDIESPITKIERTGVEMDASQPPKPTGNFYFMVCSRMEEGTTPAGV